MEQAMFGAGCFWGVEAVFQNMSGVLQTRVGYAGGHTKNPTYREVCTDLTGHAEVVYIEYDPMVISYADLLRAFWENHDPTTLNRQGPDTGSQYRSAVFYYTEAQKLEAEKQKTELNVSGRFKRPIVTQISPAGEFTEAEEYHQKYLQKRGLHSCHI